MGKKLFSAAMACLLLAALAIPASAGGPPKATGGVTWAASATRTVHTSFNAQGGSEPRGQIDVALNDAEPWHGTVTCYTQVGNRATFGGVVDAQDGDTRHPFFIARVVDNGEGSNELRDQIVHNRIATNPSTDADADCEAVPPTLRQTTEGNLKVHQ